MSLHHAVGTMPRFAPTPLSWSLQLAFAALAAAAMALPVRANPVGGVVVGGQASIVQPSPALMQINQSSQRAVIDWRSFSIGMGEAVRFNQPAVSAATLNRVVGNEPSSILGSMTANGRVYLVNQNGVFIGRDAQIDAAGLVLSTANIGNADFMAGRLNFSEPGKPGARIVNEGSITAAQGGLVALVAPGVENRGVISAKLGQVILAGAPAFSLDLFGDGMVNLVLRQADMSALADATGKPLSHYVDHSGKVTAEGGRIWISAAAARGVVDSAVKISGELRATRVAQQGGEITLLGGDSLHVSGQVIATGVDGGGGRIAASADKILLASNAVLNGGGATDGGTVHVGGSFQGQSPVAGAAATARTLQVDAGARIAADAGGLVGKGGQVVLWSEDDTRFAGSVSARAGAAGGDGGLMEVSGKKHLVFEGSASAAAPQGIAGTLLLDPGSLTVAASGTGGFTTSGADSTVAAGTINQVLRSGTSVALQADDNITVNAQIDGRAPLGGTASPGGGLSLAAGGTVAVNAPIVLNDGAFNSTSGSFVQAVDGIIATLGAKPVGITASGDIASQYLLTSGNLSLVSTAGNIVAGQALGGKLGAAAQPLGSLTASAPGGSASLAGGVFTSGDAALGGRSVQLGQAMVGGTLAIAAGSDFQLLGDAQVGRLAAGDAAGPLAAFSMVGAAGSAPQLDAAAGGIAVHASKVGALGTLRSGGDIALSADQGNVVLGTLESTGAGSIRVTSGNGAIELPANAGIVTRGGSVALGANGGVIQALGAIAANDADPAAPAAAPGTIRLEASGDIGVRQLVALGSVDIVSKAGSVALEQTLGGADAERPLVGVLRIGAGKDVTTNGLNLAGSNAAGADGLRIEAGTAGPGRIFVNERIGVSAGNLHFGSATPTRDHAYDAVLRQGVYARNGDQDITFNVPVLADGSRINQRWRSLLANPAPTAPVDVAPELADQLTDMMLIQVELGNSDAQSLVEAGGGLRVAASTSTGNGSRVTRICPPVAGCAGDADYWMVPKVVISNQETPRLNDPGSIRLDGGIALAQQAAAGGSVANAALKVIVPMSAEEAEVVTSLNESLRTTYFRQLEVDISTRLPHLGGATLPADYLTDAGGQLRIDRLSLNLGDNPAQRPQADSSPSNPFFDLHYLNGVAQVVETTGTRLGTQAPGAEPQDPDVAPGINAATDLGWIVYAAYPGKLGDGQSGLAVDGGTITPSGTFGFNSNSNPASFAVPQLSATSGVDLSAQILAALPPTAPATPAPTAPTAPTGPTAPTVLAGDAGTSGETVGLLSALESRVGEQPDEVCPGRQRVVVGRSAGDEVDIGASTALRGAPRSVFQTRYVLGQVSERLAIADRSRIAGTGPGDPCL